MRDEAGYREICELIAKKFDDPKDPRAWEKEEVARACLHAPAPALTPERLVSLTQRSVDASRSALRLASLATALYRENQYDVALERLNEARTVDPQLLAVRTNSLRAMIHHRLGQPEPARQALRAAEDAFSHRYESNKDGTGTSTTLLWWLEVEEDLFFREANLLVAEGEPKEDPRYWRARAESFLTLGRRNEAIASYSKAVQLRPDDLAALARRSELYFLNVSVR